MCSNKRQGVSNNSQCLPQSSLFQLILSCMFVHGPAAVSCGRHLACVKLKKKGCILYFSILLRCLTTAARPTQNPQLNPHQHNWKTTSLSEGVGSECGSSGSSVVFDVAVAAVFSSLSKADNIFLHDWHVSRWWLPCQSVPFSRQS